MFNKLINSPILIMVVMWFVFSAWVMFAYNLLLIAQVFMQYGFSDLLLILVACSALAWFGIYLLAKLVYAKGWIDACFSKNQ